MTENTTCVSFILQTGLWSIGIVCQNGSL